VTFGVARSDSASGLFMVSSFGGRDPNWCQPDRGLVFFVAFRLLSLLVRA